MTITRALVSVMLKSLNNQLTKLPALWSRHWILIQFIIILVVIITVPVQHGMTGTLPYVVMSLCKVVAFAAVTWPGVSGAWPGIGWSRDIGTPVRGLGTSAVRETQPGERERVRDSGVISFSEAAASRGAWVERDELVVSAAARWLWPQRHPPPRTNTGLIGHKTCDLTTSVSPEKIILIYFLKIPWQ